MFILFIVSIPQAVSTVATWIHLHRQRIFQDGFNTASGKYCCNREKFEARVQALVSIPQAVSTVATYRSTVDNAVEGMFQYRKR